MVTAQIPCVSPVAIKTGPCACGAISGVTRHSRSASAVRFELRRGVSGCGLISMFSVSGKRDNNAGRAESQGTGIPVAQQFRVDPCRGLVQFPGSPLWQQSFKFQLPPRILVPDSIAWGRRSSSIIVFRSNGLPIQTNRALRHRSFASLARPFLGQHRWITLTSGPKYPATCPLRAALGVALRSDLVYYSG